MPPGEKIYIKCSHQEKDLHPLIYLTHLIHNIIPFSLGADYVTENLITNGRRT